jgi:hypothetical protein
MATKSGKVQLKDIKVGKTFYLVHADFPIVGPHMVGTGEVQRIKQIRVTSRPFFRRLSATMAFKFVDATGREDWLNLDEMVLNHTAAEITREDVPYFTVWVNHRAMRRFWIEFERRQPTPAETRRVQLREAGLHANQRSVAQTPQFQPNR